MITRNRKISVDDYPEHLNPFADDDNEDLRNNRFNTTGRRRARPSLKDAWESSPSPALDVAVTVRGPTPARPPPPRLSMSPPPPPPAEVQRQAPPARPLTQPPPPTAAPDATPGKPARRRFSFSRTLDAGSRLLLSPALLRRFRPGAAPAPAAAPRAPPAQPQQPAAPDLRASIRRSQSQAIPTTPPPVGDTSGLSSRAGSNWTLAEGGFPQRIPSYRPKKRRAPPPPPPSASKPAAEPVTVTLPPAETSETRQAEQQAEVGVSVAAPAAAEVTETTTTVVVTVAPATPPSGEPPALEVSVTPQPVAEKRPGAQEASSAAEAASYQEQQQAAVTERVAPLAEGEDMAVDEREASRRAAAEEEPSAEASQPLTDNTPVDHPGSDAAVSAASTEPSAPSEVAPASIKTAEVVEEQGAEPPEQSAGNSETEQLRSTPEGEATVTRESSPSKLEPVEVPAENTPQVLTLTIREYKEPGAPTAEAAEVSQEAESSVHDEAGESRPVTSLETGNATVEVEVKVETTTAPQSASGAVSDVPLKETGAEAQLVDGEKEDVVSEESPKSTLASFREDYLIRHYKGDLPVLQITESDLADEKQTEERKEGKEGSSASQLSTALPVLHISEEDLREKPAEEEDQRDKPAAEEAAEAVAAKRAANGPSPAERESEKGRERETASPSPRRSLDAGTGRKESPQPPPRQSSAQELNSKIYFRVLPPLAGGGAAGGAPLQLKTFSPPSSPPGAGRGPKPQPPLRNGVAAPAASGEVSPPRTKSPLPTPRRRHQPVPRDA